MDPFVVNFLTTNGLTSYIPAFKEARINKKRLSRINSDLAKELIENSKHRVNFLLSLEELNEEDSDGPVPEKKFKPEPAKTPANSDKVKGDDYIRIQLRSMTGKQFNFKVKKTTKFSALMRAYSEAEEIPEDQIRFVYKGDRHIDKNSRLSDYNIADGDCIGVSLKLCGC